MAKKIVSLQKYGQWLINQSSGFEDLVSRVAVVTASVHPSDHQFSESPEFPGTCGSCGWIDPTTESDCDCPMTLAEHIKKLPEKIEEKLQLMELMSILGDLVGNRVPSPHRYREN